MQVHLEKEFYALILTYRVVAPYVPLIVAMQ